MKYAVIMAFAILLMVSCTNKKHSSGAFDEDTTQVDTEQQVDTPKTVTVKPADPSQVPFRNHSGK